MLTLEERERRAYITNSPDHALIVEVIEGDEELREEIADLKKEADRIDGLLSEANDGWEAAETKVQRLEQERDELQQRIDESGVDLVA